MKKCLNFKSTITVLILSRDINKSAVSEAAKSRAIDLVSHETSGITTKLCEVITGSPWKHCAYQMT